MTAFELFALFMFGHYLADYPLQGSFLAMGKNRFLGRPKKGDAEQTEQKVEVCCAPRPPWLQILAAHAGIHGGFVGCIVAIVGIVSHPEIVHYAVWIGLAEMAIHMLIDDSKCSSKFGYNTDQSLHFICKALWALLVAALAGMPLIVPA